LGWGLHGIPGIAQIGVGDKRRIFLVWGRDREKLIGYAPFGEGTGVRNIRKRG
jgi:hypothetical protein